MAILRCDRCQTPLPGAAANTGTPVACPACGATLIVQVFPAFGRPAPRGRSAEPLASAEDAGCFYHPQKKAVVPCEDCGRFLCALCDLEIDGRHVCPACVENARQAGRPLLLGSRTLHDRVAQTVLLAGTLLGVVTGGLATLLAGPIALGMTIFYWNEPARSPVPRRRTRLVVIALLSLLQIAGWSFALYSFVHRHSRVL